MEQLIEKLKEFWGKAQQFIKKIHLPEWSKKIGSGNNGWSISDVFAVFLRTFKLLMNMAFAFIFFGAVIGAGIGIGYAASLFSKVEVPKQEELVKQVNNISGISKLTYADGSLIAEVDNDLLRIPVKSDAISENVKKAVIATEDENFETHNGVVPKAVLRATLGSVVGVGSSSGGSTITQLLI